MENVADWAKKRSTQGAAEDPELQAKIQELQEESAKEDSSAAQLQKIWNILNDIKEMEDKYNKLTNAIEDASKMKWAINELSDVRSVWYYL